MTKVVLATWPKHFSLGQSLYESMLADGLTGASACGPRVEHRTVTALRGASGSSRRVPLRAVGRGPRSAQRALGLYAYGNPRLVHRCDLRLPPALGAEVLTIHDTAWLRFPDEGRPPLRHGEFVRRARAIVVPSAFSKDEVTDAFGIDRDRVYVIPNAVDPMVTAARPFDREELQGRTLAARYFLAAGGGTQRKNLAALAAAWRVASAEMPDAWLLLSGHADLAKQHLFAGLDRVSFVGVLERAEHVRLIASAHGVVVPSLYEGFGYPVAEALALGVPAICTSTSSLPEVAAGRAVLVDPTPEALADALLIAWVSEERPEPWQVTTVSDFIAAHLRVYEEALAG